MRRAVVERARAFRKTPTRGEAAVWGLVRRHGLGVKFYRQQPIGPFIADFACERHRLVVEIDGPVHDEQRERDQERRRYLEDRGYRVLAIAADEAEHDLPGVAEKIREALEERRRAPGSPPRPPSRFGQEQERPKREGGDRHC